MVLSSPGCGVSWRGVAKSADCVWCLYLICQCGDDEERVCWGTYLLCPISVKATRAARHHCTYSGALPERAGSVGQEDHDDAFKRDSTPVVRRPITVMVMRLDSRESSESSVVVNLKPEPPRLQFGIKEALSILERALGIVRILDGRWLLEIDILLA